MSFSNDNFNEYCRQQVNYFIGGLRSSIEEEFYKTAHDLQQYICSEMQTLNSNEITMFMDKLYSKILEYLNNNEAQQDKKGLILAIIILVSVDIGNTKMRCSRFAHLLRTLETSDVETMEFVAYAIGRIALASGSALTDSYVDYEVTRALEYISENSNDPKTQRGILILQELAISTPNSFSKHYERFFEIIFRPLIENQNQNNAIQEKAVKALRAVLNNLCKYEKKDKQCKYFNMCFNKVFAVIDKTTTVKQNSKDKLSRDDKIHGALLIINELLRFSDIEHEKLRATIDEIEFRQNVFESSKSKYKVIREWGKISTTSSLRKFIHSCSKIYSKNNSLEALLEFHSETGFKPNTLPSVRPHGLSESTYCRNLLVNKYDRLIKLILREKDTSNSSIQKTILTLLPKLAICESFYNYSKFEDIIRHVLNFSIKKYKERSSALISLGLLCCVSKEQSAPYLMRIFEILKSYLNVKDMFSRKKVSSIEPSVVICIYLIVKSFGNDVKENISELIDSLVSAGLSPALSETLYTISKEIPDLKKDIQEKLFKTLFLILIRRNYVHSGAPGAQQLTYDIINYHESISSNDNNNNQVIILALEMLGRFNFNHKQIIQYFIYNIHNYLFSEQSEIRLQTVKTCFKLLKPLLKQFVNGTSSSETLVNLIQRVLNQLLLIGTTNSNAEIRYVTLSMLNSNYDHFLTQPNHLQRLFICLNDEVFEIRELAIFIIGRLSEQNPAYIKPRLRSLLIEQLNNLENSDSRIYKEQSTRMLSHINTTSPKFACLYSSIMLNTLINKLKDQEITNKYMITVLYAIGLVVRVSENKVRDNLDFLFPILLEIIQDSSNSFKREVGLWTLGQVIDNTGCVVDPYWKYKNLLEILLNIFRAEQSIYARREATKVLGLVGAVDPYEHKIKIGLIDQSGSDYLNDNTSQQEAHDLNCAELLINQSLSLDNFYLAVAITNMLKIIKDVSLSTHHIPTIEGVNFMFVTFTSRCIPFIHQVFPLYLSLIKNSEHQIREAIFCQLCSLVPIVKDHIKEYLDQLFLFIKEYWEVNAHQQSLINLVEQIAVSLKTEFKQNLLPKLLPNILKSFCNDKSTDKQVTLKILSLIQKFDNNSQDFLSVIMPRILIIFEDNDYPVNVRERALKTVKILSTNLDLTNFYSMILQPSIRVHQSNPDLKDSVRDLIYSLVNKYEPDKELMKNILAQHKIFPKKNSFPPDRDENDIYESSRKINHNSSRISTTKKPIIFTSTLERIFSSNLNIGVKSSDYVKQIFIDLLNDTPSTALKAFLNISRSYDQLPKDVFNAAFYSCWTQNKDSQMKIVKDLEKILTTDNIPEVITMILNLVEFMDHTDCEFPIDLNLLSETAINQRAYAKALRFKENEFLQNPSYKTLESLVYINNKLRQQPAVNGIMKYAEKHYEIDFKMKEQWHEKQHKWENAKSAYQLKLESNPNDIQSIVGLMRCLEMLGEYEELYESSSNYWSKVGDEYHSKISRSCATAAWNLGKWEDFELYSDHIKRDTSEYPFYKAILALHKDDFSTAQNLINSARDKIDSHLTMMAGESQDRAYGAMVSVMLFSELEEAIQYKMAPEKRDFIKNKWWNRLSKGCQKIQEDWQKILRVHSLVLSKYEDRRSWLKFASICQKANRVKLSNRVLSMLIKADNEVTLNDDTMQTVFSETNWKKQNTNVSINCPLITYGFIKSLWRNEDKKQAFEEMKQFNQKLYKYQDLNSNEIKFNENTKMPEEELRKLTSKTFYKLGHWQGLLNEKASETVDSDMLNYFEQATIMNPNWYKAWNSFALSNYKAIAEKQNTNNSNSESEVFGDYQNAVNGRSAKINKFAIAAIKGFFKSISLSHGSTLQDTLRLLTILFNQGQDKEVANEFNLGLKSVPLETWLQVIPQLIARIDIPKVLVNKIIQQLLIDVSKCHPQALIYSLTVAQKSSPSSRNKAANIILKTMSEHSNNLVTQALLVSDELIRVSILWLELWHESLEEASRLYFGEKKVKAMLETLEPLHKHLERGPTTLKEMSFKNAFGNDLKVAQNYCQKFLRTGDVKHVTQAWEFYYHVFKKISKQLHSLTSLELQYVSPKLLKCVDLELAVPGVYHPNKPVVKIAKIDSELQVINSKQRPRKLRINGSNGKVFLFLLKGHEDLRQDERVMQLFGLVNTILAYSFETRRNNLAIQRYSVIPLSNNSGLIGWVPHCDTLHTLIKDHRDKKKILVNIEHRIMLRKAPNFDRLTIMQKVEIFEHALDSVTGDDIHCIMWNKSPTSEIWFERRTNYTRSLAVMSMVGYILGLGDRHPSNLMIDRLTGKVLHIDYGDCFEVAMTREKFPEKVPFRLTRMLIKAMEVTGLQGTYQTTCENVLEVLRHEKDSLLAVLEAFVYDPVLDWTGKMNWGVQNVNSKNYSPNPIYANQNDIINTIVNNTAANLEAMTLEPTNRSTDIVHMNNDVRLNKRSLAMINRIIDKLTGRDFDKNVTLDVSQQVELLIAQATSNENLCQLYIGYCFFW